MFTLGAQTNRPGWDAKIELAWTEGVSKKHPALDLGPLPVDVIERTLGLELAPGDLHMSGLAHRHAAEAHPEDYPLCVPHLQLTARSPLYIGQAPRHRENIEFVRRVPNVAGRALLMAVGIVPDRQRRYRLRSFYLIDETDVTRRRAKGYLKLASK